MSSNNMKASERKTLKGNLINNIKKLSLDLLKDNKINYRTIKRYGGFKSGSTYEFSELESKRIDVLQRLANELKTIENINQVIKEPFNLGKTKRTQEERKIEFERRRTEIIKKKRKGDRFAFGERFKISYVPEDILNEKNNALENEIKQIIQKEFNNINKKYELNVYLLLSYNIKFKVGDEIFYLERKFSTKNIKLYSYNYINSYVDSVFYEFNKHLEENHEISNSVFNKFTEISVFTAKLKSVFGSSYIELPEWIKNKKACINIKNDDDRCFEWAILSYFHYNNYNRNCRVTPYKKHIDEINKPINIKYPITLNDIEQYEHLNNFSINVFEVNKTNDDINLLYKTVKQKEIVINLLLIYTEDYKKSHYVLIKDLNKLYSSNSHKVSHATKYRCKSCFRSFYNEEKKEEHENFCNGINSQIERMPTVENNILKFTNEQNKFLHPYFIIADFESTLEKVDKNEHEEFDIESYKYQKHVPNSYALKFNCIHNEYSKDIIVCNNSDKEELNKSFIEQLEELAKYSYNLSKKNVKEIKFKTAEQSQNFYSAKNCNNCKCEFTAENKKVKHHDHISGYYIEPLCNNCNLKFQYKRFLPVYFHNLKGYDAHLFVNSLFKYGYNSKNTISCIPNNEERYISFSKSIEVDKYKNKDGDYVPVMFEIRFLDTFAFMADSIENLTENLKKDALTIDEKRKVFKNTSKYFKDDEQFLLMIKKGIYPYDYIDSYDKFDECLLPKKKHFYSKLNDSKCSEEEYKHALKVWRVFECNKFLDYHNIYLKSDVLLLSDIWENFRNVCYKIYKLDPCYYYTAPGLSFDAMLYETKIELELLTDLHKFKFVESGIRGGISQISHRYAKANNKYMTNYNKENKESYIAYYDANNLYGYSMCQYLPVKGFKWNDEQWDKEKILSIDDKAEKGFMFSIDLHIPQELHEYFNNYPLCPENISIKKEWVSDWMKNQYNESPIKKLCLTFFDKKEYVVNYRYLKLVLSLGVELIKVNRVLEYEQKDFMKSYIMKNTNLRIACKNEFEKNFYKLMNNACYGKTMENVRKRINFKLISDENKIDKLKNLSKYTIFNEDLVGVHIRKDEVVLNKPIYLGQNILDDSKQLMADFHYNFMLKKIKRENLKLLFTDTDSLCYYIENQDIFEIMKENKDKFDLSDYPKNHELYDPTNKKVIGKFKNESIEQITEFVGLRSKLYTYKVDKDESKHNRCKGVKRYKAENILFEEYKNVLLHRESFKVQQNGIRSYAHQLYTEKITKVALSCEDDKVYVCEDNITTYNHGYLGVK